MKKINLCSFITLSLIVGVGIIGAQSSVIKASADAVGEDFFNGGENINYGEFATNISFQGQKGIQLFSGSKANKNHLSFADSKWVSGENATSAVLENYMVKPGSKGIVYQWTAPQTGTFDVKGMVYNHYAFTTTEDLSSKGVAPREAGTSATRDGVTIKVNFDSKYNYNVSGDYNVLNLPGDYTKYVKRSYYCLAGDKLTIEFNGNNDFTEDDISFYFNIEYSKTIVEYNFNTTNSNVPDSHGTVNNLNAENGSVIAVDQSKGVHFNAGQPKDNTRMFYDYKHQDTDAMTNSLTEFCLHVKFTIEGEDNDWKYVLSTTSHEGDQSKRGFGLSLNHMLDEETGLPQRDSRGKIKYSLNLRVDKKGPEDFFTITTGWINDLVDGGTYDAYVNCSSRQKKIESFCYGDYQDGWVGTNANYQTIELEDTWTMNNPGAHSLVVGAFNEAAENGFHGWISKVEILSGIKKFTKNMTTGPFRDIGINSAKVISTEELAPVSFNDDVAAMIESAPKTATLNLADSSVAYDSIVWDTKPIYTLGKAYLVGRTSIGKYDGNAAIAVKSEITSAVVTLVQDGEYSSKAYAIGATNDLPTSGIGFTTKYYTDSAKQNEFTSSTFTESVKLYVDINYTKFSIIYNLNGGVNNAENPTSYTIIDSNIILKDPTKTDCVFGGWYSDAELTQKVVQIVTSEGKNITLYAKWNQNRRYTITYNLDGGTNSPNNPTSFLTTDGTIALEAPTKDGHTFKGWYIDAEFKSKVTVIDSSIAQDITLYAKWEKIGGSDNSGLIIGIAVGGAGIVVLGGCIAAGLIIKKKKS